MLNIGKICLEKKRRGLRSELRDRVIAIEWKRYLHTDKYGYERNERGGKTSKST